jgi:hypothetical protein
VFPGDAFACVLTAIPNIYHWFPFPSSVITFSYITRGSLHKVPPLSSLSSFHHRRVSDVRICTVFWCANVVQVMQQRYNLKQQRKCMYT